MNPQPPPVSLSPIDSERFGITVARAGGFEYGDIDRINDFCRENGVDLLIARIDTGRVQDVREMQAQDFFLADTLIYYYRSLENPPIPEDTCDVTIRDIRPGEEDAVRDLAAETFKGYSGHYHADKKLDPKKCDEAYASWAYRSCVYRDVADNVLVAELDGKIAGFATLKMNDEEEGEGVLFGIAPWAQKKGIYRSFMIQGMRWLRENNASRMVVSTQINNTAVQKVWVRLGFEPGLSMYTLHKWFEHP